MPKAASTIPAPLRGRKNGVITFEQIRPFIQEAGVRWGQACLRYHGVASWRDLKPAQLIAIRPVVIRECKRRAFP
jgi:hypothetical protein